MRRLSAAGMILAVALTVGMSASADASVVDHVASPAGGYQASALAGDFNGDGASDIALSGATYSLSIPVAASDGTGGFTVTNSPRSDFANWAARPGVQMLTGDFNNDKKTDIALIGGPGWNSIPVAFANGNGTFTITNGVAPDFATWAQLPDKHVVTGDFNNDGRSDIALAGSASWNTVPVAFSNGDGTFTVTNGLSTDFATWAAGSGVQILAGDFNNDKRTDIALTGGAGWNSVPVAFSNGDGTFAVTNGVAADFASWAQQAHDKHVVTGDFNRDGRTDIAMTGSANWNTIPVALSNGNGTFAVRSGGWPAGNFAGWGAQATDESVVTGDFNNDGRTDIAMTGSVNWNTVPVALANADGTFTVRDGGWPAGNFGVWGAQAIDEQVVTGDFNNDGRTDIAMTGSVNWNTIPVALANADGTFAVKDGGWPTTGLGPWAAPANVTFSLSGSELEVTVNWTDNSNNETGFVVYKRDENGNWRNVHFEPTGNGPLTHGAPGYTGRYSYIDTDDAVSGHCYTVTPVNDLFAAPDDRQAHCRVASG